MSPRVFSRTRPISRRWRRPRCSPRRVLRVRALAVLVPIAGMMLGDAMLGFYDWRVMTAVYGTLALPACAACLSPAPAAPDRPDAAVVVADILPGDEFCRLGFQPDVRGECGRACQMLRRRLPFLHNMVEGDLFWGLVLFGGYWLLQNIHAAKAKELNGEAVAARARFDGNG